MMSGKRKSIIQFVLIASRIIVYIAAIWLSIEYISFLTYGNSILYYKIQIKAANSFPETIRIVHNVFNIQHNVFANVFGYVNIFSHI